MEVGWGGCGEDGAWPLGTGLGARAWITYPSLDGQAPGPQTEQAAEETGPRWVAGGPAAAPASRQVQVVYKRSGFSWLLTTHRIAEFKFSLPRDSRDRLREARCHGVGLHSCCHLGTEARTQPQRQSSLDQNTWVPVPEIQLQSRSVPQVRHW